MGVARTASVVLLDLNTYSLVRGMDTPQQKDLHFWPIVVVDSSVFSFWCRCCAAPVEVLDFADCQNGLNTAVAAEQASSAV